MSDTISPALAWKICASIRDKIDTFGSIKYLDLEEEISKFVETPSKTDENTPKNAETYILSHAKEKTDTDTKEKRTDGTKKVKTCQICGEEFIPGSNRQKICKKCREKSKKQRENAELENTVANILAAGDNA